AIARLRDNPAIAVALSFVRFEPYVLPKRSLTGDTMERVDTRVLQAIYAFRPNDFPAFVGQQVDVFIKASTRAVARQSPPAGLCAAARRTGRQSGALRARLNGVAETTLLSRADDHVGTSTPTRSARERPETRLSPGEAR